MKFYRGSSLVQYAIILSTIGVVGIAVFWNLGSEINSMFNKYLASYTKNNEAISKNATQQSVSTGSIKKGDLGGTPDQPKSMCTGNMCTIDYGELVLNGIPEDYGNFLATTGSSGTSDKIIDLISQIGQQLAAQGDIEGSKDFQDLANLGHMSAKHQANIENITQNCINNASNKVDCIKQALYQRETLPLNDNVKDLLPLYGDESYYLGVHSTAVMHMGYVKREQLNDPSNYNTYTKIIASTKMLDIYEKIMNDPKYSPTIKSVSKEIILNYNKNAEPLNSYLYSVLHDGGAADYDVYSIETGELISTTNISLSDPNQILHPNTSTISDLHSALVCATGQYDDTGKACN